MAPLSQLCCRDVIMRKGYATWQLNLILKKAFGWTRKLEVIFVFVALRVH